MKIIKRDITTITEGLIIHGVNSLGVMGSGIALAIKNKWPEVYKLYKKMPTGKEMLGQTHFIRVDYDLYIGNCYTQLNFGRENKKYADINAIKKCLESSFNFANLNELDLFSPQIGCGLGGLNWEEDVYPIFQTLNKKYEKTNVIICYI